jgi:hypothetical protein
MDSALETAVIAAAVSLSVSFISPAFTHHLWKRQKRKEQQLAIAQRYFELRAQTSPSLYSALFEGDQRLQAKQADVEMSGLLFLIPIFFKKKEVLVRAAGLRGVTEPADNWIYFELQAFLFAEALNVPFEKVPDLVTFKT